MKRKFDRRDMNGLSIGVEFREASQVENPSSLHCLLGRGSGNGSIELISSNRVRRPSLKSTSPHDIRNVSIP